MEKTVGTKIATTTQTTATNTEKLIKTTKVKSLYAYPPRNKKIASKIKQ